MTSMRVEHDTMGEVQLPHDAYYSAQTQRACDNFPISGRRIAPELIHALGLIKWAAAKANADLGQLGPANRVPLTDAEITALLQAAREVADGSLDDEFPIDVYQTGSGTSSNMNANEVIANRALELAGLDRFNQTKKIHPNDHVNRGQSTNDMFPTAIHVATAVAIRSRLVPALLKCEHILEAKAAEWSSILKIGRTHLADATPMSLGQEMSGFARQMSLAARRAEKAVDELLELPVGGTAVGTGINTHAQFAALVAQYLSTETGISFREAVNHFEANAARDGLVTAHALIKAIAVSAGSVANNIRWLGSGPRCGFNEIILPDLQPGSSIMPGKVNPVLCESLLQVACRIVGNDQTITTAGLTGGQFQLNITMPVLADTILESIRDLTNALAVFADRCLAGMTANAEKCQSAVEQSLSMATGLNPYIGYEKAAAIAKEAYKTGKTVRELCREQNLLPEDELEKALDPWQMTKPLSR
ncbi:MAG: class II fumarate hydratase [Planctomycetia bacterium]|nr:class II fumarate hydratase [Planctomycetia bacterium]